MAYSLGIQISDFWQFNPKRLKPIQKTFIDIQKNKSESENANAWLIGLYVQQAVGSLFGGKYPSKPMDFSAPSSPSSPIGEVSASEIAAQEFMSWAKEFQKRTNLPPSVQVKEGDSTVL